MEKMPQALVTEELEVRLCIFLLIFHRSSPIITHHHSTASHQTTRQYNATNMNTIFLGTRFIDV